MNIQIASVPKNTLHANNPHKGRYDMSVLSNCLPELKKYICKSPIGEDTIDFSNQEAVLSLNRALLFHFYNLTYWDIPKGFLCPPIPSRSDYIHHIVDALGLQNTGLDKGIHALDIGTGANLIYPIIGSQAYGWRFTATDIDPVSVENAKFICERNRCLKNKIKVKLQKNANAIFKGIINNKDWYDVTLCNPPFHASLEEAVASNQRKKTNLTHNKQKRNFNAYKNKNTLSHHSSTKDADATDSLNFGGQKAELWCKGGEIEFLRKMATESYQFAEQVGWFTTLVSKSENILPLTKQLKNLGIQNVKEINMSHGQKKTRVIAWSWVYT